MVFTSLAFPTHHKLLHVLLLPLATLFCKGTVNTADMVVYVWTTDEKRVKDATGFLFFSTLTIKVLIWGHVIGKYGQELWALEG